MARRRKQKPPFLAWFLALGISLARSSSQNRLDNARESLLKMQAVEKRFTIEERLERTKLIQAQRKYIEKRTEMLNKPNKPAPNLLGDGINATVCPTCGTAHAQHLNALACTECGTQLSTNYLDIDHYG